MNTHTLTLHPSARPPLRRIAEAIADALRRHAERRRRAQEAAVFAELSARTLEDIGAPDRAWASAHARREDAALRLLDQPRW